MTKTNEAMKQPLYQTMVERTDHSLIPVGPKWSYEAAVNFTSALAANIIKNQDKEWRNPHVVRVA